MAKLWFAKSGSEPTAGEPSQELDVNECVSKLGLAKDHWRTSLEATPSFGEADKMQDFRAPEHVVVEIGEGEAAGWKSGFYLLPIKPNEARKQLRPDTER